MLKQLLLMFMCCALPLSTVVAQDRSTKQEKEFEVNFKISNDTVLREYKDNSFHLDSLSTFIRGLDVSKIDSLVFVGSSSPEGSSFFNKQLALQRSQSLYNYVTLEFPLLKDIPRSVIALPKSWVQVIKEINTISKFPNKQEVIEILKESINDPEVMKIVGEKYRSAYVYMYANILPLKRNVVACIIYYSEPKIKVESVSVVAVAEPIKVIVEVIEPVNEIVAYNQKVSEVAKPEIEYIRKPVIAFKTNLLYDVASVLNVELEIPIGERWSIAGELMFPWWLWESKQNCLQVMSGIVEGRYWFGNRQGKDLLTGLFAGVHVGGGYYDIEWQRKGYQGEFYINAGVSGGYAHKIGRALRMEYSLGIGFFRSQYREYDAKFKDDNEWHLIRSNSGEFTWVGPTRVKVSLVWMPSFKFKKRVIE